MAASGGTGALQVRGLHRQPLPAGLLSLNTGTGAITGTPTAASTDSAPSAVTATRRRRGRRQPWAISPGSTRPPPSSPPACPPAIWPEPALPHGSGDQRRHRPLHLRRHCRHPAVLAQPRPRHGRPRWPAEHHRHQRLLHRHRHRRRRRCRQCQAWTSHGQRKRPLSPPRRCAWRRGRRLLRPDDRDQRRHRTRHLRGHDRRPATGPGPRPRYRRNRGHPRFLLRRTLRLHHHRHRRRWSHRQPALYPRHQPGRRPPPPSP